MYRIGDDEPERDDGHHARSCRSAGPTRDRSRRTVTAPRPTASKNRRSSLRPTRTTKNSTTRKIRLGRCRTKPFAITWSGATTKPSRPCERLRSTATAAARRRQVEDQAGGDDAPARTPDTTLRSAATIRSARITSNDWMPIDWMRDSRRRISRRFTQAAALIDASDRDEQQQRRDQRAHRRAPQRGGRARLADTSATACRTRIRCASASASGGTCSRRASAGTTAIMQVVRRPPSSPGPRATRCEGVVAEDARIRRGGGDALRDGLRRRSAGNDETPRTRNRTWPSIPPERACALDLLLERRSLRALDPCRARARSPSALMLAASIAVTHARRLAHLMTRLTRSHRLPVALTRSMRGQPRRAKHAADALDDARRRRIEIAKLVVRTKLIPFELAYLMERQDVHAFDVAEPRPRTAQCARYPRDRP